jgi:hypothetical protein
MGDNDGAGWALTMTTADKAIIDDLTLPLVRDLCWVMASPSLIAAPNVVSDGDCRLVIADSRDWLRQLDRQPQPLRHWADQCRSPRLGYYFEQLVAFWLRERIAPGRVKSHVRVFRNKRVLGEYDFLFQRPGANSIEHWEAAVKFYLRYRDPEGNIRWLGPNTNDTLDQKLSRLMDHQLMLSDFPEARSVLQDVARELCQRNGLPGVESRAFIKGYLFYPSTGGWREPATVHPAAAPGHLRGWWTRIDELCVPGDGAGVRYMLLPRLHWLAPKIVSADQDDAELLDAACFQDALESHFTQSHRPVLVAVLTQDRGECWREQSRGFVVNSEWPGPDGSTTEYAE